MADKEFLERAARRRRLYILLGIALLLVICGAFAVRNSFYDLCTGSFNRDPKAVVEAYLQAISNGDPVRAQDCWDHNAFFDLTAGCSEICLSRIMGTQLAIQNIEISGPTTADGRSRIEARISAACGQGQKVSGALTLDSVSTALPWKHWRVIRSEVGGTANQPWCRP